MKLLKEKSICKINEFGSKFWYNSDGQLHREDGPAVEYINGNKVWYQNGERHREDGPAVEWFKGIYKCWFLNDTEYSEKEYYKIVNKW